MRALAEKEQADIGGAKNGFDALSQIIEANVTTAGIIAEKTKNLEELKQTIINSITELSAISEENAASNEISQKQLTKFRTIQEQLKRYPRIWKS